VSAAELLAFAAERLARFKLPKEVVFMEALPRTPYGKVVKRELTESWLASRPRAEARERAS
jgi:long-chain acyl-CoA synthetase